MEVIEINFNDGQLVERYDNFFDSCPNAFIQQSTYWADVIRDIGPDKPIFLLCNDDGQDIAGLPLYLYQQDSGNILTSVPQPGPLGGIFYRDDISDEKIEDIYRILLKQAVEIAERYHCITLSIITNPFNNDMDFYEKYLSPDFVFENFTQCILNDEIFEGNKIVLRDYNRRSALSRNLKAGKEYGYEISFCEDKKKLQDWYEIHKRRHTELGAQPLTFRLFENMFKILVSRDKARLILLERDGQIASGCFFIYHRNVMDVFMLSMNSDYARHGVNYVNTDYSIHWARDMGISHYNWQSSQSRESGVYEYKKRWGSVDNTFYYVTKLLCKPETIQEIGLDSLKRQYQWHYVVPFGVFSEGFDKKYFKKG